MDTQILKPHIALNVRNVEESTEFYRKMLGIEPAKVRPGYAKFDIQNPALNLTLNAASQFERGGLSRLSHLGLQAASTDDVLAIRNRWAAAGLTVRNEMQTECCYALQDKAWVHDPDGNEWEVFTVLGDVEESDSVCCQPLVRLEKV
jgi:catechol 2,3-dioxygenase-like lactoylglutathione lyase family enzyme